MEHPVVKKPLSTPKSTIEFNKPYGTPCSMGPLSKPKSTIEFNKPYGTYGTHNSVHNSVQISRKCSRTRIDRGDEIFQNEIS